jgi:HEAT repeat protein
MSQIVEWLSAGDLRSDGLSDEIVGIVLQQPQLLPDLLEGLDHPDGAVRGHAADALEKVTRLHPELLLPSLPRLISLSRRDPVEMVRMHLAMIFGHLAIYEDRVDELVPALLELLQDESAFAVSWAITSLCIFGRLYPNQCPHILQSIAALSGHASAAVRSKVNKALHLLSDETASFPRGWVKSELIASLIF